MTISGWIFMLVSWTVIIGLFGYCVWRTLQSEKKDAAPPDEAEKIGE